MKTKLPKPSGPDPIFIWTLGVTKSGIVYAGQGPEGCGNSPTLVRYGRAGDLPTGTVIHTFPAGKDFNGTYVRSKADGSVDIYYARVTCSNPETTDIYRANDPAAP